MLRTVGILGLGSIGQRHARNLMQLGYQVLAHDPADEKTDSRDFVIDNCDTILICSPTKEHVKDLIDCGSKKKHVLVEKPIAWDAPPEYVRGILEGVQTHGKFVATGFNLRFHHAVQKAKEIIDGGDLGKINRAIFNVLQKNTRPEYLRDGVISNWASHEIDLARYLLGDIQLETCEVQLEKGQDVHAYLKGAAEMCPDLRIHADYLTDPETRTFTIEGDDGQLQVNLVTRELHATTKGGRGVYAADDSFDQNYLDEITTFLACTEGKSSSIIATGFDGYHAHKIVYEAKQKAGLL